MEQAVMRAEARTSSHDSDMFTRARQSGFTSLFYDPPYANELDDALARHLVAYLVPAASLDYKAVVWAVHSWSRFDFLIDLGRRRVAIDYSETPENLETALVEDNDALVLGAGVVDAILRVRRRDLEEHLYDCLHLIAKWEPNLFTPYGQRLFASRSTETARNTLPEPEADLVSVFYAERDNDEHAFVVQDAGSDDEVEWPQSAIEDNHLVMRRMSGERPDIWRRQYERATLVYGRDPIRRMRRV